MVEMVRSSRVSAAELVNAHAYKIQCLNPRLNAFIDLRLDQALSEAKHIDAALEKQRPLEGVPVSIKSCIDVAGMRCEAEAIERHFGRKKPPLS